MRKLFTLILVPLLSCQETMQETPSQGFAHPEKSWVFWYWRQAAVTKEGITADLEAMKEVGLGGAYLMPISGPTDPPHMEPVADQLSPYWWKMVKHSVAEAKRLDLKLGFHASDGFALAGGPWITPELSMQKIVWSETQVHGGATFNDTLAQPESYKDYYNELGIYAYPNPIPAESSFNRQPTVSTSNGNPADFLVVKGNENQFQCEEDCWFQYSFDQPLTAQSIQVITKGNNYQSHRLKIESSEDGETFTPVYQMIPPRHGWQDTDAEVTYSVPKTTARFFRFQWTKVGSEPGAEDLDAAKWSPILKIAGLELSGAPRIHQYEGKSGKVWRISPRTTEAQLSQSSIVNQNQVIDLTNRMDKNGVLNWEVPEGDWTILRMGHTSTGHTNYTGGEALGLECDKFNPEAINIQFEGWYGRILDSLGSDLTREVVRAFHVDSWECGSQNWSPVFRAEFKNRQGYDPLPFLPIMAGVPLNSADFSEKFLYDIRATIADLMIDNFYGIMAKRAHDEGMLFSAESVAPTMLSDGMQHYGKVDIPMGEFWLNSPTHDKPNDMMDAISGAHVYGKNIIQAEGFTELRMAWDEHPGMLKTLLDRNYALGINRLFFHVYMHNPWMDRRPGMTLDGVGLYFQRDQTWWKPGREFVKYAERCQKLLQEGMPVVDVAVFTGEGFPRRSILPDRLVQTLPGLFGAEVVNSEATRLTNKDQPLRTLPKGVKHSQNMADPEDWVDPLNGYKYDSFNKDALINLSGISEGQLKLSTGASYQLLVLPQPRKMAPNPQYLSKETLTQLIALTKNGMTLLISEKPIASPGLDTLDKEISQLSEKLWEGEFKSAGKLQVKEFGKGKVIKTPFEEPDFESLGIAADFLAVEAGFPAKNIAWTHRRAGDKDIYFISNQVESKRALTFSLRVNGKLPIIYNPVTNQSNPAHSWEVANQRTKVNQTLHANESIFIILEEETELLGQPEAIFDSISTQQIDGPWKVSFNPAFGGTKSPIEISEFKSWTEFDAPSIKYYSGTATYETQFNSPSVDRQVMLAINGLHNIAEVMVNGKPCGVIWTAPYEIDISEALKEGENQLTIAVTNTWRNRMIRDHDLPEEERLTWTTAPYRLDGEPLLPAGITGSVSLIIKN